MFSSPVPFVHQSNTVIPLTLVVPTRGPLETFFCNRTYFVGNVMTEGDFTKRLLPRSLCSYKGGALEGG